MYGNKIKIKKTICVFFSTITTWGEEGEVAAFRNMLTQFPDGLVACVSDSYNIWEACEKIWGGQLKGLVEERGQKGGTLVVRPDSGDPATVVVKVSPRQGSQSSHGNPPLSQ